MGLDGTSDGRRTGTGHCTIQPHICHETAERVIRVSRRLTMILGGRELGWSERRYVAGTKTDLIFPLTYGPRDPAHTKKILSSSVSPRASSARKPLFCCPRTSILICNGTKLRASECSKSSGCTALSFKTEAPAACRCQRGYLPTSRRHLKHSWDRLAIAANACAYDRGLDHRKPAARTGHLTSKSCDR